VRQFKVMPRTTKEKVRRRKWRRWEVIKV